jgi:hypothetical protein
MEVKLDESCLDLDALLERVELRELLRDEPLDAVEGEHLGMISG